MRKILFITYHYHPDAAVGAVRTVKYAKFLPSHGWQPHILTAETKYYERLDETPLDFDCPVTRTGKWITPDDIYHKIRPSTAAPKQTSNRGSHKVKPNPTWSPLSAKYPKWKRLVNSLSLTPDINAGWYRPAVKAALRLISRERYDAIYSSGPPHTCHVAALKVAKKSGLPWVIDFRDPWYEPERTRPHLLDWSKDFDRRKEMASVLTAALVVTTTPEWRERLIERYDGQIKDKCVTVLNGYDETEFPPLKEVPVRRPPGPTTFFHGGTLYAGRNPNALLQAAGELIREGFVNREGIRFNFYGNVDFDRSEIDSIIAAYDLCEVVTFAPGVKKADYIQMTLESDVLILFQSDMNTVHLPAKTFEYLATGNRILTLTGEGATQNFMKGFDHVSIAYHADKNEIKVALKELLSHPQHRRLSEKDAARIGMLTKEKLAAEFASLLTQYIPEKK